MERRRDSLAAPAPAALSLGQKLFGEGYGQGLAVKLSFTTGPMLHFVKKF